MPTANLVTASRVGYQKCASGVRITLDGQALGPVMSRRSAGIVARWLEGGGLAELDGDGKPKIQRVLQDVDRAIDSFTDIMKNGLR